MQLPFDFNNNVTPLNWILHDCMKDENVIEFPGTRKALILQSYPWVPKPPKTEQLSTAKSQMKLSASASIPKSLKS